MAQDLKARFWVGILWNSSMVDDWQAKLEIVLQIPYCYIVHDKDLTFHGDPKDMHTHIMVAYGNTTTEASVKSMFNELSKPGMQCCNKVFRVRGVKYMYDYLIHDTQQAKKDGKHLYLPSERHHGLGWDTDAFNQMQIVDKLKAVMEISQDIVNVGITTYSQLYQYVVTNYDLSYLEIMISYSGHFDRMVKGVWQER